MSQVSERYVHSLFSSVIESIDRFEHLLPDSKIADIACF